MIQFLNGDLFTSHARAIGHGVNCKGAMGSGIAVAIRTNYPEVYREYRKVCLSNQLSPGDLLPLKGNDSRWVLNIASQNNTGRDARLPWLEAGMRKSFEFCLENDLPSFAVPRIGAGIGGLDWTDVRKLLVDLADEYVEVDLEVWTLI